VHSSSFFFNAPSPSEIYTLSLHDALPIFGQLINQDTEEPVGAGFVVKVFDLDAADTPKDLGQDTTNGLGFFSFMYKTSPPEAPRSEEHTSELQSRSDLVCRLLLEKKKKNK